MKADFEKGTKVCYKCKKELPIEMFYKMKGAPDGLDRQCKECHIKYNNKTINTFLGELKAKRGRTIILKRDYELTEEQLKKRETNRKNNRLHKNYKSKNSNPHGILIWYDEKLNELNCASYHKILSNEYNKQKSCAIRGYIGRTEPSEHFLFDFDLEQMLKDNVYYNNNGKKKYITKWWDGEIRHWTVNDGIWKK